MKGSIGLMAPLESEKQKINNSGRPLYIPMSEGEGSNPNLLVKSQKSVNRWSFIVKMTSYGIIGLGFIYLFFSIIGIFSLIFTEKYQSKLYELEVDLDLGKFHKPILSSLLISIIFGLIILRQGYSGLNAAKEKSKEEAGSHLIRTIRCITFFVILYFIKEFIETRMIYNATKSLEKDFNRLPQLINFFHNSSECNASFVFQYGNGTMIGKNIFEDNDCLFSQVDFQIYTEANENAEKKRMNEEQNHEIEILKKHNCHNLIKICESKSSSDKVQVAFNMDKIQENLALIVFIFVTICILINASLFIFCCCCVHSCNKQYDKACQSILN